MEDLKKTLVDIMKTFSDLASNAVKEFGESITKAAGAIYKLGTSAVQYNAAMEQYELSFEMMLGSADEAAGVMENLKNLSEGTSFEFKDLAETTQLLMNYGMSAETAQESLLMFGDISQGSAEKLKSIVKAYGQMSTAGKVQLTDIQKLIELGFNPLEEISESTGETMESLNKRLSEGTLSVDEITNSMQRATSEGGAYFQAMEQQSQTVSGQFAMLKENFQMLTGEAFSGLSESIGGEILPMALGWVDELSVAFEENGATGLVGAIGNVLSDVVAQAAQLAPNIIELAVNLIQTLLTGIQENLPQIVEGAIQIIAQLITGFVELLPQLLEVGLQIIGQLIIGIAEAMPTLIPTIIEVIGGIVNALLDNIGLLIDAAVQLIVGLGMGLVGATPTLIEMIPQIVIDIVDALIENAPQILSAGLEIIITLASALITYIPEILKVIPTVILTVINAFMEQANAFSEIGSKAVSNIKEAIVNGWENIKTSCSGLIDGLKQYLLNKALDFLNIGSGIVSGIWNGISGGWDWLIDQIGGLAESLLSKVKSILKINSPSKEFAFIGRMCVAGWEQGAEGLFSSDAVTKNIKATLGSIQADLRGGVSNTYGGYTQVINVNREIATPDELARAVRVESRYGLMRGVGYGY